MFERLSERLAGVFSGLRGKGRLSEADVDAALREIRLALLEADVNFKVARDLVARIRERAVGVEVSKALSPGQQVVKIVHEELVRTVGEKASRLEISSKPPTVYLVVGLQGSGKTTTAAKLAVHIRSKGHRPLLVAGDQQRPAAIEQLRQLGARVNVPVWGEQPEERSLRLFRGRDTTRAATKVTRAGLDEAQRLGMDVVIVDTAGRLAIDDDLMAELREIRDIANPTEVLLVVDAMTGQDATETATRFNESAGLTGVILTKLDGDARGGAALSVREAAGVPIKLVGTGEGVEDLDVFHPERMVSRILDLGDVMTLIEKAEAAFDENEAARLEEKFRKASFTLEDFLDQLDKVRSMGPISNLIGMLPGASAALKGVEVDDAQVGKVEAIIRSMTPEERRNPAVLNGSRRARIARGSGTQVTDVNALIRQFGEARKMMKTMSRLGANKRKKVRR